MTAPLRAAAVLLIGVLVSATSFAGANVWTNSGPSGGSPRELLASPTEANVFYASFGSGMYRSTDGGVTWNTLREFESLVSGFAIDPSDADRIYVAVYDAGVYGSTDGGATFNLLAPISTGVWAVGASGATVYYATNARTFHRSSDHGQTWTEVMATPEALFKLLIDANDANIVYGSTRPLNSPSNSLFKSTDGGNSWTTIAIHPQVVASSGLAQLSPTRLITVNSAGIFISNDSGASWTQVRSNGGGQYYGAVAAVRPTPGHAVASLNAELLLTTDFGATWSTLSAVPIGTIINISLDAQAPARMVVTSGQGAAYSSDGGLSWTRATQSPIASSPSELITTVANNSKIYTYADSGGLFSTSGDSGWQRLNLAAAEPSSGPFLRPRIAVRPGAPNTVYITPQGFWPVRSEDGGNTWSSPTTPRMNFDAAALAFDTDDSNIVYAAMKRRTMFPATTVYRSLDGGANWAPHSTDSLAFEARDLQIDPVNGARMFAAGSATYAGGGLWRSIDRGVTWGRVALSGVDVYNVAIHPTAPTRIYTSAQSGLYVTSDGGNSFAASASFGVATGNRAATSVQIDPAVPGTVYAVSQPVATISGQGLESSSHVLRSVDDGQTWEVLRDATATPRWAVTDLAIHPNEPSSIYVTTVGQGIGTLRIAPDLAVEISGHAGTRPRNEQATFNLRAVNNGPYAATVVRLTANLPAGLTNLTVTPDRGNCTAAAVITCDAPVLRVGEAMNLVVQYTPTTVMAIPVAASVVAHESDVSAANNSVEATAHTEGDFANLSVAIQPSATSVTRGGGLTYSITVTNAGPVIAGAGTLTFTPGAGISLGTLPNGCSTSGGTVACSLASMAVSASQSFAFPVTVTHAGTLSATATVSVAAPIAEFDPSDNSATATITAAEPPPSSGGGGGGGFNIASVLALLILLMIPRRRRNSVFAAA